MDETPTQPDRAPPLHLPDTAATLITLRPEAWRLPGLQRENERPELLLDGRLIPSYDLSIQFLRVTYEPGTESCPTNMTHNARMLARTAHRTRRGTVSGTLRLSQLDIRTEMEQAGRDIAEGNTVSGDDLRREFGLPPR